MGSHSVEQLYIPRAHFCEVVQSYVNTPFHHRGRTPGVQLDCAGVVVCGLEAFGLHVPDVLYGPSPTEAELFDGLAAVADIKPLEQRQPADVLAFEVGRAGAIHIGVYLGRSAHGTERVLHPTRRRHIGIHALTTAETMRSCWQLRGVR